MLLEIVPEPFSSTSSPAVATLVSKIGSIALELAARKLLLVVTLAPVETVPASAIGVGAVKVTPLPAWPVPANCLRPVSFVATLSRKVLSGWMPSPAAASASPINSPPVAVIGTALWLSLCLPVSTARLTPSDAPEACDTPSSPCTCSATEPSSSG
ncbi:hypothetical protein EN816_33270 [Mesorhizobium sp. M8A.F.Ca.ET.173.01.1.1]|nr:hypothetical protein EN816_33270 [Mesorhizobium sp. M8A.F.Ca.ET.173.01.1.1]